MATKPRIAAAEALRDLRSGMDDSALMRKYRLSAQGLQSLLRQLVERGCIAQAEIDQRTPAGASISTGQAASREETDRGANAELVQDVRSGMHDFDLMEKYELSTRILEGVLDDLVRSGSLEQSALDRQRAGFRKATDVRADADKEPCADEFIELTWECPVCGIFQSRAYDKCPECGALVALLTRKRPT